MRTKAAATRSPAARSGGHERRRQRATGQRQIPWLLIGAIGLVILALVAIVVASQRQAAARLPSGAELTQIVDQVTGVPPTVFEAVGTGGITNPLTPDNGVQAQTGKPRVLYIGAEFCPYCASDRWSLIAALSRFGQFQNLRPTQSSATDAYPNTPTFTFDGSTYASPYIDFTAVETASRDGAPLHRPSSDQQAVMDANDSGGSIPFVDVAGRWHTVGSGVDTSLLVGKSWVDIASGLGDPQNAATRAIVGNANDLTAAICQATGNQPAEVCTSQGVASISAEFAGGAVNGQ